MVFLKICNLEFGRELKAGSIFRVVLDHKFSVGSKGIALFLSCFRY